MAAKTAIEQEGQASKPRPSAILSNQIESADFVRGTHVARPARGVPAAALLDPAFWAHVSQRFTIGDRIEVLPVDSAYDLDLRVIEVGRTWARVRVLRSWPDAALVGATAPALERPGLAALGDGLVVEWGGPSHKYRIVRKTDRAVIQHGFVSEADAQAALKKAA